MPIFSAIGAAIVGAVTGVGYAAAAAAAINTGLGFAVAVVSAGVALATARVISKSMAPDAYRATSQAQNDPGVRIQLPPATDNKIPVFYGNVVTSGIVTHANISANNQTMTYVLVLSEQVQYNNPTYTINQVYRNDEILTIDNNGSVTVATDADGNTDSNIAGKLRVHVYAGNATSNVNQIYPPTNKVAANTVAPVLATDGASMANLVYAVVSMDYDAGNNLVGLGTMSFDIANNLYNPANVLYDYLTNPIYGAGLTAGVDFDTVSLAEVYDYANTQVDYTPWDDTDQPQDQWRIDGILSTYQSVKRNIDAICQSCATWFTYNPKIGKFAFVPNRAATAGEKANAFVFNDDNIISAFDITSTELYSLYNTIEAEHPQYNQKDQTDVVHISIPSGSRNPNEPDNKLTVRYDLVNDNSRVKNLANIDLRQSRFGTVITFVADYSALQCDVGDIVKLTNAVYGYDADLFRVVRIDEQEGQDGTLTAKLILLEYDDAIYDHEIVLQKSPPLPNGVPNSKNNYETAVIKDRAIANSSVRGFANGVILARMIDIPDLIAQEEFANITANVDAIYADISNIETNVSIITDDVANIELELANAAILPITETDIANNSISTPKLQTNSVTSDKIIANAITADKIGALQVTTAKLDALAVTTAKLDSLAVTTAKLDALAVTTAKLDALAVTGDKIAANTITSNKILAGNIAVDRLASGTFATTSGLTFGLGVGANLVGIPGAVTGFSNVSSAAAGLFGAAQETALVVGAADTYYGVAAYGNVDWAIAESQPSNAWSVVGTLAFSNVAASTSAGGYFYNKAGPGAATLATEDYAGEFGASIRVDGTTLPFTGSHEVVISNSTTLSTGDILVDVEIIAKSSISDTTTLVDISNTSNQKGVVGVYAGDSTRYPIPMTEYVEQIVNEIPIKMPQLKPEYANLMADHKTVVVNALGEGQINVNGENGNIVIGDLIVSSSTAGKGMKQADDIMRSITVAKARESATFNTASEVKQIACIYLAG